MLVGRGVRFGRFLLPLLGITLVFGFSVHALLARAENTPKATTVITSPNPKLPLMAPLSTVLATDVALVGDTVQLAVKDAKVGTIYGDSMPPVLGGGTVVIYVPISTSTVRVGDIIVFESKEGLCIHPPRAHQVWKIDSDKEGWLAWTWGVANRQSDLCQIRAENLIGKVLWISVG